MRNTDTLFILAAALAAVTSTAAKAGDSPVSVTIDNYAWYDTDTASVMTGHELDVVIEGTHGDFLLGAEVWLGLSGDFGPGTITIETPELTVYAEHATLGRIDAIDIDGALDAACVIPAPGSTHFGTEDLMTVATCAGYGDLQGVLYTSPDVFGGVQFLVSAATDVKNLIAPGEVDTAISAALLFTHEIESGATITASLGVDQAVTLKGGAPGTLPTTFQAGAAAEWDGWTVGVAGQYEVASTSGGNRFAVGAGVTKAVTEQFVIGGEVSFDQYEDTGVTMNEVGFGATAEYFIVPDSVSIDGAFNVVHRTGGGVDLTVASVGAGVSFAF